MRTWIGAAIASATVVAAAVLALVFSDASSTPATQPHRAQDDRVARFSPAHAGGVREDCSTRSEASFPGAFTSNSNLVVGPLVLVGGAYTDPSTVREYGGNKFPLLVRAGHVVTVRLDRGWRGVAGLAYGPLPQGETKLRDTHQRVTFVACLPDGPSASVADGVAVTFWSGFVVTRAPACIPLDVYVDEAREPRRVGLALGRRCG